MATTSVEKLVKFSPATFASSARRPRTGSGSAAASAGSTPPPREVMESYWKGALLVPERSLLVGRLDGVIAGSAQLVRHPRNNEARAHSAQMMTNFVASWARGHGLARAIALAVEDEARGQGVSVLNLDVRESQAAAISSISPWAIAITAPIPAMPGWTANGWRGCSSGRI